MMIFVDICSLFYILGFFLTRGSPPPPHPFGSGGGGEGVHNTLACGRGDGVGGSNSDEGTDTVVLEVYTYFVLEAIGFLVKFS
jgi:hypothetical protein